MQLKSIQLRGFKSFPHKTDIAIGSGITVIIGPNGSGKSNISDAVRWVLGEISSKNLRGNKMEDIIFGGTDKHSPMGFAEVSLIFDNSDNSLPFDFDEVIVTRKYYRTGESEYLINRKTVRLKDIVELFLNTGLGKSGYSIVGQGHISDIVSKKSEDRREIFEESAGIAKYRYKKNESERKLAGTRDNLSRVDDILGELVERLPNLEIESSRARQYLDLYASKKEADVSLMVYEIDAIKQGSEKMRRDYEMSAHQLELVTDDLTSLENQVDNIGDKIREASVASDSATRKIAELNDERHNSVSERLRLEKNIELEQAEQARLGEQVAQLSGERDKSSAELVELRVRKGAINSELATLNDELGQCDVRLDEIREMLCEFADEKTRFVQEKDDASAHLMDAKLALATSDSAKSNYTERLAEIELEMGELSQKLQELTAVATTAEKTHSDYSAKLASLDERALAADEDINSAKSKHTIASEECADLAAAKAALVQRIEALSRMREHFEGFDNSVKTVMKKSADGQLDGVFGPVSGLLSTPDSKVNTAIETALGSAVQNIVVRDVAAAKSAMNMLKTTSGGRATFYPVDTMKPSPLSVDFDKLQRCSGYVGVASELVKFDKAYAPVMEYLLGRTVICDNIDNASDVARVFGYKFKIVTLDGQVINAGGSLTGGTTKRESGILGRNSEIERQQDKLHSIDAILAEKTASLDKVKSELAALELSRDKLLEEAKLVGLLNANAETEFRVKSSQVDILAASIAALKESKAALANQDGQYDSLQQEMLAAQDEAENNVTRAMTALEQLEQKIGETNSNLNTAIDEKNAQIIKISAATKDLVIVDRDIEQVVLRISTLESDIAVVQDRARSITEKQPESVEKMQQLSTNAVNINDELIALNTSIEELKSRSIELDGKMAETRARLKEKLAQREKVYGMHTRLSVELGNVDNQQEKYVNHLWDEYELSYSAAVALEFPRVTEETKQATVSRLAKLRRELRELGNVNVGAIEEYAEVRERHDFLDGQAQDLRTGVAELESIISSLEVEMTERFLRAFNEINSQFRLVFTELFGGGSAELVLLEPENPLTCGIEINVAPPGKVIKSLSLLSGGEQVFVAIALLFAVLRVNPPPFCFLDEIDAALDEVNVARFAAYTKRYSDDSQIIIISHRRGTMDEADVLFGVTMQERGISKILRLDVNEVEKKLGKITT